MSDKNRPENRLIVIVLITVPLSRASGELGVTVWSMNQESGQVISDQSPMFRYSFPQIASCGRRTDGTNYFAFVVASNSASLLNSRRFQCLVFEATDRAHAKSIVSAIAQGFERTHWTL